MIFKDSNLKNEIEHGRADTSTTNKRIVFNLEKCIVRFIFKNPKYKEYLEDMNNPCVEWTFENPPVIPQLFSWVRISSIKRCRIVSIEYSHKENIQIVRVYLGKPKKLYSPLIDHIFDYNKAVIMHRQNKKRPT